MHASDGRPGNGPPVSIPTKSGRRISRLRVAVGAVGAVILALAAYGFHSYEHHRCGTCLADRYTHAWGWSDDAVLRFAWWSAPGLEEEFVPRAHEHDPVFVHHKSLRNGAVCNTRTLNVVGHALETDDSFAAWIRSERAAGRLDDEALFDMIAFPEGSTRGGRPGWDRARAARAHEATRRLLAAYHAARPAAGALPLEHFWRQGTSLVPVELR